MIYISCTAQYIGGLTLRHPLEDAPSSICQQGQKDSVGISHSGDPGATPKEANGAELDKHQSPVTWNSPAFCRCVEPHFLSCDSSDAEIAWPAYRLTYGDFVGLYFFTPTCSKNHMARSEHITAKIYVTT